MNKDLKKINIFWNLINRIIKKSMNIKDIFLIKMFVINYINKNLSSLCIIKAINFCEIFEKIFIKLKLLYL